jgi:hypothetical protein
VLHDTTAKVLTLSPIRVYHAIQNPSVSVVRALEGVKVSSNVGSNHRTKSARLLALQLLSKLTAAWWIQAEARLLVVLLLYRTSAIVGVDGAIV